MEGKIEKRKQARILRTRGKSLNQIAAALGVAKSSVSVWVRDVPLKRAQRVALKERELVGGTKGRRKLVKKWREYRKLHPKPEGPRWPQRSVEQFFDAWTPEMAYVLGYFAADGCMYRNKRGSCYVAFTSTDLQLIGMVKGLMEVANEIEIYQPKQRRWKTKYNLQIGSKKMYRRLLSLGFSENKSLTLAMPKVPDVYLGHFARGYLDGDGSVYFRWWYRRNRPNPTLVLLVRFTSGSRKFLSDFHKNIQRSTGIDSGSLSKRSSSHFDLGYSARAARQLYEFMYPSATVPCLKRKRTIYERALLEMVP